MGEHLILRLEAPLMSFGGEAIDNFGVVRDFPAASMLTGLIANALGWHRGDVDQLDRLQDRLVFAVRIDRPGTRIKEYQTARLLAEDQGWTTRGRAEGRNKDSPSFKLDRDHYRKTGEKLRSQTHERFRDYDADALVCVVLRLDPENEEPTLNAVAAALDEPARPLFLGRKPCLPAAPILVGRLDVAPITEALQATPCLAGQRPDQEARAFWPEGEGFPDPGPSRTFAITDRRNWRSGVHGGARRLVEAQVMLTSASQGTAR